METPLGFNLAGPRSMENGNFETKETQQIPRLLRDVSVFINVGSNVGYYVCLARQAGAKVVAIEPLDQNVQMLQRSVSANGWSDIEIFPLALAERVGLMKLYGGGTAASLIPGWAGAAKEHYRWVSVVTLDTLLADRFPEENCGSS